MQSGAGRIGIVGIVRKELFRLQYPIFSPFSQPYKKNEGGQLATLIFSINTKGEYFF